MDDLLRLIRVEESREREREFDDTIALGCLSVTRKRWNKRLIYYLALGFRARTSETERERVESLMTMPRPSSINNGVEEKSALSLLDDHRQGRGQEVGEKGFGARSREMDRERSEGFLG